MKKWVRFELYSGYEDDKPQRDFAEPYHTEAVMVWCEEDKLVKVYIGYEALQPLVREGLTDAEKRV